ncbi:uncharacterized protein LOC132732980 [Ruditapes philippinarum]|uniref:uncharacterized protein LOC132732980 n=1 Tax=Ruditapes philippinarum TaxID=129788 RepID=UPI00295A7DBC|nr:uncharacterized protein LOC132732980 [Ruditapes philippinarum]
MNSTILGEEKNITLYTPPSFNENVYKTYPTIFVLDLNLEFAYSFQKKFEEPIYPHAVADEFILIGFGDYDFAEVERVDYLTPTTGPTLGCINGTFGNRCHGCVPVALHENAQQFIRYLERDCGKYYIFRGDSTLDFLEKEALPFANKMTSMRLQDDNIGVMGYSLGALLSCYAIWTRPAVYSFAACQSPPFWMPINSTHPNVTNFDFLTRILKDPTFQVKRPEQKIYFDAGGAETNYPYRITQATIEAAKTITQFQHYELNRNVWIFIDPGKGHSFTQWKKRIGQALTTLLPAQGAKRIPSLNDLSVG